MGTERQHRRQRPIWAVACVGLGGLAHASGPEKITQDGAAPEGHWRMAGGGYVLLGAVTLREPKEPPPTCYPDCDNDGQLTFFDFLCFQNAFLAKDPYADCDGNDTLDFFDFLCFQNEFLAGCP